MEISAERIAHIIAFMYKLGSEITINSSEDRCILFSGLIISDLELTYEEVEFLINNEMIECYGGNADKDDQTKSYLLTDYAEIKIKEVLKNKKELLKIK